MNDQSLTLAIIGHLAGDYLLQNDWMAMNKKKSPLACAAHCVLWTATVCLFAGWISPIAIGVLFATHFIQDHTAIIRWYMKVNRQDAFATGPCAPWSIIVVDNVWHIVTIAAVWRFAV